MSETGTPSNHATPYFIFVILLERLISNLHSKYLESIRYHPCYEPGRRVVMRAFNQHLASSSMALVAECEDFAAAVKQMGSQMRRKARHFLCNVVNGGHELYRARTDTKLYQQCLLCGYETHGWTIDRRDRRLQLVTNSQTTVSSSRR